MLTKTEQIDIIISCYNNWEALEKNLWSLECQTDTNFKVILADDGSGEDFCQRVEAYVESSKLHIEHVWHEDTAYRKALILNKAVLKSSARYLLFTDADIVFRNDCIEMHRNYAREGTYMTGGSHINIPVMTQKKIDREVLKEGKLFDINWLKKNGMLDSGKYRWRLGTYGFKATILDLVTHRRNRFIGCNSACWRADLIAVGGFDESFGYSAEDRDVGVRMSNAGVKGFRKRYTFVCVHLEHKRPYLDPEKVKYYKELIKQREKNGTIKVNQEGVLAGEGMRH